jgi:hypothetical protein
MNDEYMKRSGMCVGLIQQNPFDFLSLHAFFSLLFSQRRRDVVDPRFRIPDTATTTFLIRPAASGFMHRDFSRSSNMSPKSPLLACFALGVFGGGGEVASSSSSLSSSAKPPRALGQRSSKFFVVLTVAFSLFTVGEISYQNALFGFNYAQQTG